MSCNSTATTSETLLSGQVFEYFSSVKRNDGLTFMKPEDLLAALVAVYPPDAAPGSVRAGSLPGEPAPKPVADRHKPVRLDSGHAVSNPQCDRQTL
jgi:hypothetical protein